MLIPFKLNVVTCLRGTVLFVIIWIVMWYRLYFMSVTMKKAPGMIYVLQWTSPYTEPFAFMGKGIETFVKRKCPAFNCYITPNRQLLGDITNFDVILFHGKEINMNLPRTRKFNQKYVFASMESSGYYPVPPTAYKQYFNLTWTYKLDSDIYFGYFVIKNIKDEVIGPSETVQWIRHDEMLPINDTIKNKITNKRIAAAWFVSNCETPNNRYGVVKEIQRAMKKYRMSVDIYGWCGDKQCPRSSMNNCLKLLETDYYFYFAFENSFAEDYVTEKLLHALNHYAVPVVFGGANYERFMPNGTYLDARKLEPEELVKQMYNLMNNPDRYSQFFRWHNHYSYHDIEESSDTDPYCKFCDYINRMEVENRSNVIQDFDNWWNPHVEKVVV